jgi:hypothetical protein
MLISEDQLTKAIDESDSAMELIRQHVKDEKALAAIRRKLILAIVALVPEAGQMMAQKR